MTTATYRPAPVGRAGLLARLERVLHTRGRALLTGPAGVGKTEVALAAAARAESRGETVLRVATLPADRDIPGAAAAALVATISAGVSWPAVRAHGSPARTTSSKDCRVRSEPPSPCCAARRPSPTAAGTPSPCGLPRPTLRALAARGPFLLVVDGVQRIDADSADLLRFALHLAPSALRVVAVETPAACGPHPPDTSTSQPDAAGPEPLWVPSEADVLFVPPLHADAIAELLIHHRLPSRMAGRIHKASGGNPRLALAVGRSLPSADACAPRGGAVPVRACPRSRPAAARLRLPRRARARSCWPHWRCARQRR